MKVLHIESGRHLYGGAMQVLHLMEGLGRRGVTNLLACPRGSGIAARVGGSTKVVEMKMGGDLDCGLALRVRRLIATEKPDLVHVHSRRGADLWGGIGAVVANVPCVLSRRVDNPEPGWVARSKYRLYDRVITISEGIRQVLLEQGVDAGQLACVRSAVDPAPYLRDYDKTAYRQSLGLAPDTPVVGVVAQLIPRKGHRHLLAALRDVLAHHPDTQVLIFGRGGLEAELRQAILEQKLSQNVRLMGFVDNLPTILGCLDLVVHPADMEGLGVSLLQASAARVPIVATRVGGIPEAVRDGENGLLIDAGDVSGLAVAITALLGNSGLREAMGQAGRALMLREFSVDAMCEGNLSVYRSVLSALPFAVDPVANPT